MELKAIPNDFSACKVEGLFACKLARGVCVHRENR